MPWRSSVPRGLRGTNGPRSDSMAMEAKIKSQAEYEAALDRIEQLTGAPEDTPEEHALIQLVLDVEIWRAKHQL